MFEIACVVLHSYVYYTFLYNLCFAFSIAFAAPADVSVQEKSADSIMISWTPAPTVSSVSVTYYINASSLTYQTVRVNVTDPDREVVISGLHPFAEYYITVQAGNPGGLSEPTGTSATTLVAGECCHSYKGDVAEFTDEQSTIIKINQLTKTLRSERPAVD